MNIKNLRKLTGLSQKDFGGKYDIPYRTIQNWETNIATCPDYVADLLERAVMSDLGKKVGYVFSWMTNDSGDDMFFVSKHEALKEADSVWYHNTKSEKKEYVMFEVFKIICTENEWTELIECEADYTAADRMELMIKDYLYVYNKEEFIKEALKDNGVQSDSSEVWVNIDGINYIVSIEDVLDHEETEPFEASVYLESNLEASGWDALYAKYLEEVK